MESFIFEISKSLLEICINCGIKTLTNNEKKKIVKECYNPVFKKMYNKCEYFIENVKSIYEKLISSNNQNTLDLTPEITMINNLYCEMYRLYIKEHREFYEDKFTRVFDEISSYYKKFNNIIQTKDVLINDKEYYSIDKCCDMFIAIVNTGRYVDILKRMVW